MKILKLIFRTLSKRWLLILLAPLVASAVVYIAMSLIPDTYTSRSTIFVYQPVDMRTVEQEDVNNGEEVSESAINNICDVIKDDSTLKNVVLRLLARNLSFILKDGEDGYLEYEVGEKLIDYIPQEVLHLVVEGDEDATYRNFREYLQKRDNQLKRILRSKSPVHSIIALSNIIIQRNEDSAVLEISYSNRDPHIACNTISFLEEEALQQIRELSDRTCIATFSILTPPDVPVIPDKSKAWVWSINAFFIGLFVLLFMCICIESMNVSPYDKENAEKLTGLPILGAFPNKAKDTPEMKAVMEQSTKYLVNMIMNHFDRKKAINIINVFSVDKGEGKTTVCEAIYDYLESIDLSPVHIDWREDFDSESKYFKMSNSIYDFCMNENNVDILPNADVIIVEYPPLKQSSFPTKVLSTSAINILVADADNVWTGVSSYMTNELKRYNADNDIAVILNKADIDTVGSFTGMLPPHNWKHKLRFYFWNMGAK